MTKGWNEVAWNEVIMERSDRNSWPVTQQIPKLYIIIVIIFNIYTFKLTLLPIQILRFLQKNIVKFSAKFKRKVINHRCKVLT